MVGGFFVLVQERRGYIMGDKNPKKPKKKKRIAADVNQASLKPEQEVEQVQGKRPMNQSRGR